MEKQYEEKREVEIREHSDADFYPEKCPSCGSENINRKTYKMRTIQDLGTPTLCRRIQYEKITLKVRNAVRLLRSNTP